MRARFRLQDGRDIRLAGIEPVATDDTRANRTAALSAIIAGHDVTLRGEDDSPDRYGRQPALVFLAASDTPVQSLLLAQGDALVSATVTDRAAPRSWIPPRRMRGRPNAESGLSPRP